MSVLGDAFVTFRRIWEERAPDNPARVLRRGLRRGQLAAAYAGAAHALGSDEVGTVVMPTGSGKSAVMILIAGLIRARRVLVIVSSQALRQQLADKFRAIDPFVELGLIDEPVRRPTCKIVDSRPSNEDEWRALADADVVVALPQSISPGLKGVARAPTGLFDLVLMDEAHHAASDTWSALLDQFVGGPRLMFTATPYRLDGRPLPGRPVFTYTAAQAYEEGVFGQVHYEALGLDPTQSPDVAVRDAVIARLAADAAAGFDHRILVKCKTIDRAEEVAALYRSAGCAIKAVHSRLSPTTDARRIAEMRAGELQGLACANMLGEGFDEPKLKIAGLHDQDKSLPITLQFIGRFARTTRPDIGPAHFFSVPSVTQSDAMLIQLYARDAVWGKLVVGFADTRADADAAHQSLRQALWGAAAWSCPPLGPNYWELLRPRQKAWVYRAHSRRLQLDRLSEGVKEEARLYSHQAEFDLGAISLCVEGRDREPGWSEGGALLVQSATLYIAFRHAETGLLFFHCSGGGPESSQQCLEAIGAGDLPRVHFEDLNRVFQGEGSLYPFNVGLRTRAHVFGAETYRSSLGKAAGDTFRASDGARYHRGHCSARVDNGEVLGMSDASKVWGGRNLPVDEFVDWCSKLASRISGTATVDGRRGYFSLPVRKPITEIARGVAAADWPPIAYSRNLTLTGAAPEAEGGPPPRQILLREVKIKTRYNEAPRQQMTLELVTPGFATRVVYRPAANRPFSPSETRDGFVPVDGLRVRDGAGDETPLIDFLNDHPPSLFTLYGAAMIGREGLPELTNLSIRMDPSFYEDWDWTDVRLKAERRAPDRLTVQDRALDTLRAMGPDALFFDDGSGELADIVSVKRTVTADQGEVVTLGLFHCKASSQTTPGARVDDYYEVAGQAIKSTQRLVFSEIREHLRRRVREYGSRGFVVGDIDVIDSLLSGDIQRLYSYEIAVVQPGLSVSRIQAPGGRVLADLIARTREMIEVAQFAKFRIIGSA